MLQNGSQTVDFDDPMDHHIGMHIWMESDQKTPSLSISNLGTTLEHIYPVCEETIPPLGLSAVQFFEAKSPRGV